MKRTCSDFTCGNVRPGEAYDDERDCRQCWGATHKASLAKALGRELVAVAGVFDIGLSATQRTAAAELCRFVGEPLCGRDREARGLDHMKRWSLCLHTNKPLGEVVCHCQGCGPACPGYEVEPEAPSRLEWISTAQLVADTIVLAGKLPANVIGVAGIPRSGMLPAAIIATQLHLPLWQITEEGQLVRLGHGSRGRALGFAGTGGPIAVIDDTVYGGAAMRKVRAAVNGLSAVFCAVYVRPEAKSAVDLFGRLLSSPHLLEWNIANNGPFAGFAADRSYGSGIACDFDGIFCHDEESGGPIGSQYMVPRTHSCRLIVTGRRERDRAVTESWLRANRAKWERLEMLPDDADGSLEGIAEHKAKHYAASGCGFFLESEPAQAELIAKAARKPVICPRAGKVYQ